MTALQYLLEVSICLVIFYGFYHWVLKKETFFQLNRFYLLLCPLLSFIIPLLDIALAQTNVNGFTTVETTPMQVFYPIIEESKAAQEYFWTRMSLPTPAFSLTMADMLWFVYLAGAFYMFSRLLIGLVRLFRLIRHNKKERQGDFTLVETGEELPAASFFSYIFWNYNKLPEAKKIILEHELVHVRQKHSWDVILMECWIILKWFNPIIYWYRHSLRVTHEFIADQFIARQMGSSYQYASFLATQNNQSTPPPLTSPFASMLRNRLKMLASHPSRRGSLLKYLGGAMIAFFLMLCFSFNLAEQLPEQITAPLTAVDRYVEKWSQQKIFEAPELPSKVLASAKLELPERSFAQLPAETKERNPKSDTPPYHLKWNNNIYEASSFQEILEDPDQPIPAISLTLNEWIALIPQLPDFYKKDKKQVINRIALVQQENSTTVEFCESINWPDKNCLNSERHTYSAGQEILLIWKTRAHESYLCYFSIESEAEEIVFNDWPRDLVSRIDIYSRRPLVMPKMPKPIFRNKDIMSVQWGGQEIIISRRGDNFITVPFETFQFMLTQDPILLAADTPESFDSFRVVAATKSKTSESYSFYRDFDPELYQKYNSAETILHPYMQQHLLEQYGEGFDNFIFHLQRSIYSPEGELVSAYGGHFFTIAVANTPEEEKQYERVTKGLEIDPGVNQFQLINRPEEPTIIKIDTTNQKYRWMYDSYKDKPGIIVVHIPDFKTIHRVKTLEDAILPKSQLRHEVILPHKMVNVDYQSEYYDFKDKLIEMEWRGFEGVTDNTLYELRKFQRAANTEIQIRVDRKPLEVYQFDLLIVPDKENGIKYTLSTPKIKEVENIIRAMGPRTSLFINNILIKDQQEGLLHFPLTFAFHLN